MYLPTVTLREYALLYVVKLITGSIIVWYGLRAIGIPEPIWAMISLIVVTEPDLGLAKRNFRARVINTRRSRHWVFGRCCARWLPIQPARCGSCVLAYRHPGVCWRPWPARPRSAWPVPPDRG